MRLTAFKRRSNVYNEPIEMKERRHRLMPQAFVWHGHCYRVHAVERCWTIRKRGNGMGRLHFRVRCAEGVFEVYQNLNTNTWHVHSAWWREGARAA
jgi:hypothetical protein